MLKDTPTHVDVHVAVASRKGAKVEGKSSSHSADTSYDDRSVTSADLNRYSHEYRSLEMEIVHSLSRPSLEQTFQKCNE